MTKKHQYFDQYGVEIDEQHALHNGVLKDGHRMRVMVRDADTGSTGQGSRGQLGVRLGSPCSKDGWPGTWVMGSDGEPVCDITTKDSAVGFHDGSGDPWSASRPGFRVRTTDNRKPVHDALLTYDLELTNRWKCKDGQSVCSSCSGSGLGDDGEACDACGGSGVQDDGYETTPSEAVENTAADSRPLAQRMQDHRRTMDQLYAQRDAELSEAWRNK